jgi:hypothetical protein
VGEARRRAQLRKERERLSRPMRPARFNLFAIGTRRSPTRLMSEECSYWSDAEERVLGLVFRDTQDDDYGWILLARDKIGRFRCADVNASLTTEAYATAVLRERIAVAVESGDFLALGDQKDETNYPVDLMPDARSDAKATSHSASYSRRASGVAALQASFHSHRARNPQDRSRAEWAP